MRFDPKKLKEFTNAIDKRSSEIYGRHGDGVNWFLIKDDGEYEIRVLDPGMMMTGSHWGILSGKEGRKGGTIKCPRVWDDSPCPVCQIVESLAVSKEEKHKVQARKWGVQIRYPMIVVDMNEKSDERIPRVWEAPVSVYKSIVFWMEKHDRYGDVTDLKNGRNFIIVRSTVDKGGRPMVEYKVNLDPTTSEIKVDEEKIPDLREILKPRSLEDIEHAINTGNYPEKKEGEEEPKKEERKPTNYDRGLPGPKTRDEEPEEDARTAREKLRARLNEKMEKNR